MRPSHRLWARIPSLWRAATIRPTSLVYRMSRRDSRGERVLREPICVILRGTQRPARGAWWAALFALATVACAELSPFRDAPGPEAQPDGPLLPPTTPAVPVDSAPLPGAPAPDAALVADWWAAASAAPAPVRTRHLRRDGGPRFINRMILEHSPYLRQHAHLPVDWRPWGPSAWTEARATRRLIFVSVGYATCHWCHVMEAESWDDLEVAALLNRGFIPIKVDRQEHPGVDRWALHLLAGLGAPAGWPAHLVLSPEGEPLWGAAYVPARDGDRGPQSVGLLTVLRRLAAEGADPTKRARGAALVEAVARGLAPPQPLADIDGPDLRAAALHRLRAQEDPEAGGKQGNPRFPAGLGPALLVAMAQRGDAEAQAMLHRSVRAWTRGGLMDPLAGGFHRYTTDAWQTPHFEKMLLENVIIGEYLLGALRAGGVPEAEPALRGLMRFLLRDLQLEGGCFGAGIDADSDTGGEGEGAAYTWTAASLAAAAAPAPAPLGALGATIGDRRVLNGALLLDGSTDALRDRLLRARSARPQPQRDAMALTLPNALAVRLLAEAGAALMDTEAERAALRCGEVLLHDNTAPPHARVGTTPIGRADLADSAASVQAALALAALQGDPAWTARAAQMWREACDRFGLPSGGWRADDRPWGPDQRLTTVVEPRDGDAPSPQSLMIAAGAALADWTREPAPRARALAGARAVGADLVARPDRYPWLLSTLAELEDGAMTVVITAPEGADADARTLRAAALRGAKPGQRTVWTRAGAAQPVAPWADKTPTDQRATAHVCVGDRCLAPVHTPSQLRAALDAADRARRSPRP